jgi:hypothetical protein
MKNFLFVLMTLLLTLSAFGAEQETAIVTINSDTNRDTTVFYLITKPDGSIDGMRFVTTNQRGQVETDETAPVERVMQDGIVLFRQGNYEAVRMKLESFTPENGGAVKIDYLFSGVTNTRRFVRFSLDRTASGYTFMTNDGTVIKTLRVLGNYNPLLGLIGIRAISVNPTRVWWFGRWWWRPRL